jgi:lipid-binding SYLF domain-containing protein
MEPIMQVQSSIPRPVRVAALALALACAGLAGCTTTTPQDTGTASANRSQIDAGVDATLSKLYESSPDARQLVARARGVLVFPSVLSASLIIGGEHGDGALRVANRTIGYYSLTGGSIGFQAGAQSKAIVLLFMTQDALTKFQTNNGLRGPGDYVKEAGSRR